MKIRGWLKFPQIHPIRRTGMRHLLFRSLILAGLACTLAQAGESSNPGAPPRKGAKRNSKVLAVVAPSDKKETAPPPGTVATAEEISFSKTLVIEGKVEKPQVQFTLLKEPPPEKEILFETSFLQNILKLDRENTFQAGERHGEK